MLLHAPISTTCHYQYIANVHLHLVNGGDQEVELLLPRLQLLLQLFLSLLQLAKLLPVHKMY